MGFIAAMTDSTDSPARTEINAALFCHYADTAFVTGALRDCLGAPFLITDDDTLLPQIPPERRCRFATLGLDALPV